MSDYPKPAGAPLVKDASSRRHQCFPLAVKCVLKDPSWALIHGVIYTHIAHAWLRKGGSVYDPVEDITMAVGEYEHIYQANAERAYTAKEANAMTSRTGHWGPWHALGKPVSEILREYAESMHSADE
jgi:hypothetical protein